MSAWSGLAAERASLAARGCSHDFARMHLARFLPCPFPGCPDGTPEPHLPWWVQNVIEHDGNRRELCWKRTPAGDDWTWEPVREKGRPG